ISLLQGITKEQNSIQEKSVSHEIFNELKTSNIYFEILSKQISIVFDLQDLKPTENLHLAIQKALKSNTPIKNLKLVFQEFGHYFHTKLIFGNKLQRIILKENTEYLDHSKEFDDIIEIDPFLEKWRELVQPFDSSYMIGMDGYPIKLSQIRKWFDIVSNRISEWSIVKRVVVPLYTILNISQQREIENLFIKENFVSMFEMTQFLDYNSGYQRIEYDSQLESDNYQLFGNVLTLHKEKIENVHVKFSMKTEFGFSVSWHDFRQDYVQAECKQTLFSSVDVNRLPE
ncbi:1464_t:CDS:2, partial [Ambispora gerdemannii]